MATEDDLAELDRMMAEAEARGEWKRPSAAPASVLDQQVAVSQGMQDKAVGDSYKQAIKATASATPRLVGPVMARRANEARTSITSPQDVAEIRPPTLTFREAMRMKRSTAPKLLSLKEVWDLQKKGVDPALPDERKGARLVSVGPLGLGGIQVQDEKSTTLGQLAPDEDVDISEVDGPWHSKIAPVAIGAGDVVQQAFTKHALRRIYDPTTNTWMNADPQDAPYGDESRATSPQMESVRGITNYGEAVAHRLGQAYPVAMGGAAEAGSMLLAAPAAIAAGWNKGVEAPVSDWARNQADIYYASPGTTPEPQRSEDAEQGDAWWQAAKDLAGGLSGALEGAQIPQDEKRALAQDYGSLVGRTAGTAAAMKAPTSAAAGGGALQVAGTGKVRLPWLGPTTVIPGGGAMGAVRGAVSLASRSKQLHGAVKVFDDTPTLVNLSDEVADNFRMGMAADKAESLNRSIRYTRQLDKDLGGAPWWDSLPPVERNRILTGVAPETAEGRAAAAIWQEANDAQHSVATMNAASAEAQDAIRRTAGTLHDIRTTGLKPGVTPAPMHPMHGQDISQASGDLSTFQQAASGRRGQATAARPEDFAASPAGQGLIAAGKAKITTPKADTLAELASREEQVATKLGIPEEAVPGFRSVRDRAARLRAGNATDADFAEEVAKKMRGTHYAARRYDEMLSGRVKDTERMATRDRAAMDAMAGVDEGRLSQQATRDTARRDATFREKMDRAVSRVAARKGIPEDEVRRALDAGGVDGDNIMPPPALDPRASRVRARGLQRSFEQTEDLADNPFVPAASGDILEAQARRTEDMVMDRLKVPKERREEVRRMARAAQAAPKKERILSEEWQAYLKEQGVSPEAAESELARKFTAGTLRTARKAETAPETAMPGIDLVEGHSAPTTRAARMAEATSFEGKVQLRDLKKLQKELDFGNMASGAIKTARSTSSLTGKQAYYRGLEDAARAGRKTYPAGMFDRPDKLKLANAFGEAPERVNYVGRSTGAVDLTPEAARDLGLDQDTVLIRVLGQDKRAVSDFSKGGYILNISPPPGVNAAAMHNMKVPRAFAQAMVDYENPIRTNAIVDALDSFLATQQATRSMTVGRAGFQMTNLENEAMRAIAAEPDIFKTGVTREVSDLLQAADDAPTRYGMTAGQLRERMVSGVGAGRGWYSGVAKATEDAPGYGMAHELGRAMRAKGMKRTGTAVEKVAGALDTGVEALNKPGMAVNNAAEQAFLSSAGFKHVDGFSAEDQLRMALMLRKMQRGLSPEAAARETNIILINFGDTNALQRNFKWAVPFVKYYTGSLRGALGIAARNPKQYRNLYNFMVAQEEADSVANRAPGRRINQKFKTSEQALAFRALTQDGERLKASGADYPTAELSELGHAFGRFLPNEEGQRSVLGLANPVLTQLYTQTFGVDPASGRHPLGLSDADDIRAVDAMAAEEHPVLYRVNKPAAHAMVMRDHPELLSQGSWQLGDNPDAAVNMQLLKGTPMAGRLLNQPQVGMVSRWASGQRGNNPAALTDESRESEYWRALSKAVLGARTEAVDKRARATANNRRVDKEVVSPTVLRERNAYRRGSPVKENP